MPSESVPLFSANESCRSHFVNGLLDDILAPLPKENFIGVDIQYAEIQVIPPALDLLLRKVVLLSIGTHSKNIHQKLRGIFREGGWLVINDVEPYEHHVRGAETFDNADGVLTVRNPNF